MVIKRMVLLGLSLLAGCLGSSSPDTSAGNGGAGGGTAMCSGGANYGGFDGKPLQADRVDAPMGIDRARVKPFTALAGEYQRVLGAAPASLAAAAGSFTTPAARWYIEPAGGAVTLYSSLQVAFSACLTDTATAARYANAPDATRAAAACASWAQRFWSRTASQSDLDACIKLAVQDTTSEPDPRRRWAYACAAALNAAAFLTY